MSFRTDPYTWFYRIVYFILGVYLLTRCKDACCGCCSDEEPEEEQRAADTENGSGGGEASSNIDNADRIARRRELVRGRLEIRKILSPPSQKTISKDADGSSEDDKTKTGKPPDLEKGEAVPSTSMSTTHTRDTVTSGSSSSSDDDANDSPASPSPEDNIRSKYSQWSFFAILFNPKCRIDPNDLSDSADDIASSIRSDSSFWISNLFNNSNGPSSEAGNINHEGECCSICLEPYSVGDTVARLKKMTIPTNNAPGNSNRCNNTSCCNHWFHEECILEWLQNHDDCPLCRVDMIHN